MSAPEKTPARLPQVGDRYTNKRGGVEIISVSDTEVVWTCCRWGYTETYTRPLSKFLELAATTLQQGAKFIPAESNGKFL